MDEKFYVLFQSDYHDADQSSSGSEWVRYDTLEEAIREAREDYHNHGHCRALIIHGNKVYSIRNEAHEETFL